MQIVSNRFGCDTLFDIDDVSGTIMGVCTACMSISAEFLSWANANPDRISFTSPENIVVLSCQVTDLAILNDIKTLEGLIKDHPYSQFYIGGCLAKRFDIPLPPGVMRLNNIESPYTPITRSDLLFYKEPFWVQNRDKKNPYANGSLFRDMYPLRISVGCNKQCKYCTINTTRGACKQFDPELQVQEFVNHDNILLIADSPSAELLIQWMEMAKKYKKKISIRNVEPQVFKKIFRDLCELDDFGLLSVMHCPVQSCSDEILKDMGRDVDATHFVLEKIGRLDCFTATNVIIDYKNFPNDNLDAYRVFHYVSWNPYWAGKWNRFNAELRYRQYLGV